MTSADLGAAGRAVGSYDERHPPEPAPQGGRFTWAPTTNNGRPVDAPTAALVVRQDVARDRRIEPRSPWRQASTGP